MALIMMGWLAGVSAYGRDGGVLGPPWGEITKPQPTAWENGDHCYPPSPEGATHTPGFPRLMAGPTPLYLALSGLTSTPHLYPGLRPGLGYFAPLGLMPSDASGPTADWPSANVSAPAADSPVAADPSDGVVARSTNAVTRGIKTFAGDQLHLWTSPLRIRPQDAKWLVLFGGATAGLLASDHAIMIHNTLSPTTQRRSVDFSNAGLGALVGAGGALYLWGHINGDDHSQETGLLSGESALSSFLAATALGYAFGRQRPNVNEAHGDFFRGGSSFPSDHSAIAFSIAGLISHEYPGTLTKILANGLAGAVSLSRVTGNQHFPSDVFVGGMMGWMISEELYHRHHNPDLGGAAWGGPSAHLPSEAGNGSRAIASPYVPLDSWVYPSLERLAGLGYIASDFPSTRPWTRQECARLLQEAGEKLQQDERPATEARNLYHDLAQEFAVELHPDDRPEASAQVESVYTRAMGIGGKPLNDSYHFGQTVINDFGRPYQEGFDPITGFSGWGNWGRTALYVRGEYQHSPSASAYSQSVRNVIAQVDANPVQPAEPFATINQFTLLDTYALTKLGNWNMSFGKQSMWWGVGEGGSLVLSDNAAPMYMFRITQDAPVVLPGFLHYFGGVKFDAFMGELSGNEFPPRPLMHGEKLTFKPTRYVEVGIMRDTEFGGVGRAMTPLAVLRSYFSFHSSTLYPADANPGKRVFDIESSYQIPGLRQWLKVYDEMYLPEENPTNLDMSPSPIYAFRRAAMRPGFYLSHFPHLPRLDLRAEGDYTDPPTQRSVEGRYMYWEGFYRDFGTNRGNLVGDWIGREGKGFQGWTTYWFNHHTTLQFGYRHSEVDPDFIPRGETLNEGSVSWNWQLADQLTLSSSVQYERWLAPVLAPAPRNDVTAAVQLTFWPRHWGGRK